MSGVMGRVHRVGAGEVVVMVVILLDNRCSCCCCCCGGGSSLSCTSSCVRSCQFAPSSFLQKIPFSCVLEGSLGKVVEVVPGVEDSGEGLEVEDVSVRMMRGRGSSELGSAVVTISDPGDPG